MSKPGTIKYWMTFAKPQDRSAFAAAVGTSEGYIFGQLGGLHRENPKVRLAMAIVKTSHDMYEESLGRLPIITLEGIAYPKA